VQGRGPRSEHRLDGPHVAGLGAGPRQSPAGGQLGSVGGAIAVRFAPLRAGAICLRRDPRLAWPRVVIATLPTPADPLGLGVPYRASPCSGGNSAGSPRITTSDLVKQPRLPVQWG
jgi:hypothetical protein